LIGGVHANTKATREEKVRVGRGLPKKRCGRKAPNNVLFPHQSTVAMIRKVYGKKEGQGRARVGLEIRRWVTSPRRIGKEKSCVHRIEGKEADRMGDHADLKLTRGVMAVLQTRRTQHFETRDGVLRNEAMAGQNPVQPLSDAAAGSGRSTVQLAVSRRGVYEGQSIRHE
jgi:hypothetical protein